MPDQIITIKSSEFPDRASDTVNARELHAFLDVGKVFHSWISDRIKQYSFAKDQDYLVSTEIGQNPKGGRPRKEYHLTLDMAKELSMVERTERGREARRYFIACERKLREGEPPRIAHQPQPALPGTDSVALFINRKCEFGPYETRKDVLFDTYRLFCQTHGYLAERRNVFFRKLYATAHLGVYRPRVDGGHRPRRIRGIRLIEAPESGPSPGINEELHTIMHQARSRATRINPNDLALLKIGRDIMNQIWQRFLPDEPGRSLSA